MQDKWNFACLQGLQKQKEQNYIQLKSMPRYPWFKPKAKNLANYGLVTYSENSFTPTTEEELRYTHFVKPFETSSEIP